jgi:hypothetical protein
MKRNILTTGLLIAMTALAAMPALNAADPAWSLRTGAHGVTLVSPAGRDIFGYLKTKPEGTLLSANSACCLYPLLTPAGIPVVELGPPDHRHHRGVFFAWYHLEGKEKADFWGWGAHAPTDGRRIVNNGLALIKQPDGGVQLRAENDWMAGKTTMLQEKLAVTTRALPEGNWLEFTFTLNPVAPTKVPRAAFSGFCVKNRVGTGAVITTPAGPATQADPKHDDPRTGWADAVWYDFSSTLDGGKTAGVAVISHPSNPPTKWHNLVGIGMINPCHLMDGDLTLTPGRPLILRYALLAHDGPAPANALGALATAYRASTPK